MRTETVLSAFCLALTIAAIELAPAAAEAARSEPSRPHERFRQLAALSVPFVEIREDGSEKMYFSMRDFSGNQIMVTEAGQIIYHVHRGDANTHRRSADRKGEDSSLSGWRVAERLVGSTHSSVRGDAPSSAQVSFFKGKDPTQWNKNLRTYNSIDFGEVYPGIRFRLQAGSGGVEKVFHVAPGADPSRIRIGVSSIDGLELQEDGTLAMKTPLGQVALSKPVAYQVMDGAAVARDVSYRIEANNTYTFRVGDYDPSRELIIDPFFRTTFLGGSGSESVTDIDIHPKTGQVYVTGWTTSVNFPGIDLESPDDTSVETEAFVARLNADLTVLYQVTYLGGRDDDEAYQLAVHPLTGDVYVAGFTYSDDFPGVFASSADSIPGWWEGFVSRFNGALTELYQSTYFGSSDYNYIYAMCIHPINGDIYVAGKTEGIVPGIDSESADTTRYNYEGFVARLDKSLTSIYRSTYIGGEGKDTAQALAVNPLTGDVYVAGYTSYYSYQTPDFPGVTTISADKTPLAREGFVSRLSSDLTKILRSTYIGGYSDDEVLALAMHPNGQSLYAVGVTESLDFPGVNLQSADSRYEGTQEGFVTKLDAALTTIVQSTFIGGKGRDIAYDVVVHPRTWDVFVGGWTDSSNLTGILPISPDRTQVYEEGFVSRLDPKLEVLYQSTYVGGGDDDGVRAVAYHPLNGDIYAGGWTESNDLPGLEEDSVDGTRVYQEGFVARWAVGVEAVAVTCGDFHADEGKEIALAVKKSDSTVDIYFYKGSTYFGRAAAGPVREMALASGNFDADRLDEVVMACIQEDGSLAAIMFNADGSRVGKAVGGVCSQIDVAVGQFDSDALSEFVVSLIQSDGTLAALTFDHDGKRLFKGVGGKAFAPRTATGNFDANSLDDEYVIAMRQSDGSLAAVTFQANGQRIAKAVAGACSNIDVAAADLKSGNGAQEEYVVSLIQNDGTLAALSFYPTGVRIGKGVAGSGASPQVAAGRFSQTAPLYGYALGILDTGSLPSILFFNGAGTRLGKGTADVAAQRVAVGTCDMNNDGFDEGILAYVDRGGRLKWGAYDALGHLILQSP